MTERNILPFPTAPATSAPPKDHDARAAKTDRDAQPVILKMPQRDEPSSAARQWDAVVLLHGLFADRSSMSYAQHRLVESGYFAINVDYPTLARSLDQHANALLEVLQPLTVNPHVKSINFLTHSFGGLVVRSALTRKRVAKARRAVMLAPPNKGTHLARFSLGLFHRLFPIVRQLSEDDNGLPNSIGVPEDLDIAVIAAKSDRVVKERNTHLVAQKEHCVLPTTHLRLPTCVEAIDKSLNFLTHGSFEDQPIVATAKAASKPERIAA